MVTPNPCPSNCKVQTGSLPDNIDKNHPEVKKFYEREKARQKIRKQFIREFGFKISSENLIDFSIHLVMFEPIDGVISAWKTFSALMQKEFNDDVGKYVQESKKFDLDAYKTLSKTKEYLEFCNEPVKNLFPRLDSRLNAQDLFKDTNKFQLECKQKVLKSLETSVAIEEIDYLLVHGELYQSCNCNKQLVSVDLRQANFNALHLLNPKLVLESDSWDILVKK
jgi:hypothetical protein